MNNGFDLNVKVWKLIEGEIEEIKYDGKIFTVKKDINPSVVFKPERPKKYKRNIKISYLQKWIQKGNFSTFTLEDFFKKFPKQKRNDRLNSHIVSLIDKKMISQMGNNKFKVNRRK